MKRVRHVQVAMVLAACAVLLAGASGCSRSGPESGNRTSEPRPRESDDGTRTVSVDGRELTVSGATLDVPKEWPARIPVHPDARIRSAQSMSPAKSDVTNYQLELDVNDTFEATAEWYESEIAALGWTIRTQEETGEAGARSRLYEATERDGVLSVVLIESGEDVLVNLEAGTRGVPKD